MVSFDAVVLSLSAVGSGDEGGNEVAVGVVGESGSSTGVEGSGATTVAKGGGDAMAAAPFLPCFLFRSLPLNLPSSTSSSTGAASSCTAGATS